MEGPVVDPPIPYIGPIFGGRFNTGKAVKIEGIIPVTAYKFNINLQCGPETIPRDDIGMQLSVRMLEGYVSLNSLQRGVWGEEQHCTTLPIKHAEKFQIILQCCFGHYQVIINGRHFCDFPQRIQQDRITHLAVDGDVSIVQISYTSASDGEIRAPPLHRQNEADGFQMLNTNNAITPPPSYEKAVHRKEIGFASAGSYSTDAPYSPTSCSYPTQASVTPLNAGHVLQTPYLTDVYGTSYTSTYSPSAAPLTANRASFRPARPNQFKRWATIVGVIIFCIILAVVFGYIKRSKHEQY